MTKKIIRAGVCEIIKDLFGIENIKDEPDIDFVKQYELDSIDLLELIRQLEMFTEKDIDIHIYTEARTLNQLVDQLYVTLSRDAA